MDETALIAFGILMEETVKEILGPTGDLALVEAIQSDEDVDVESSDESEAEGSHTSARQSESVEGSDEEDGARQQLSSSDQSSGESSDGRLGLL